METTVYDRTQNKKKRHMSRKKKITICIILGIIILATIYIIASNELLNLKDNKKELISRNKTPNDIVKSILTEVEQEEKPEEQEEQEEQEKQNEIPDVSMPKKMGKYEVLGQLVIDKIGVTKNILNISEDASLKLSVTKLCGSNINESGNFCICGHNWKSMLKRLPEMQEGDTFYIIDRETKTKVNYEIYSIYSCVPEDLSCLEQNDDGKREVTLITCNPGGLTRLICKARETKKAQ